MKNYILVSLIAIIGVTFAQAEVEQFYTLKSVNKGTYLGSDFVGYLDSSYNDLCGAEPATPGMMGNPACAVMKATVQPGDVGIAIPYYRIIQAHHGTRINNFAGWMEDNSVCGLPTSWARMRGASGCALIYASPYGTEESSSTTASSTAESAM